MRRIVTVVLLALLAACSMRSTIESMTAPEDRAFAQTVVERFRSGDGAWLERRFGGDLWEQSAKQLGQVPGLFPDEPGTTELIGYNFSTNVSGGRTERTKEFTLVTHGGGRWTVTSFRTYSTGGPDEIVQWSVVPHDAPPPELVMIDMIDRFLPWFWGGLVAGILLVGGLVFWLVRRSRRKHGALMGQSGGRP